MTTEKNRFLIQVLPPSQNVLPISSTVSHFFTRFERFSPSDYVRLHRHPLAQTQTVGRAKLAIASERTRAHGWLCVKALESRNLSSSFKVAALVCSTDHKLSFSLESFAGPLPEDRQSPGYFTVPYENTAPSLIILIIVFLLI